MKRSVNLILGVCLVAGLAVLMLVSLFYTPYEPNAMRIADRLQAPDASHLLGTDNFGRDVLSRVMAGTQTAFLVGAASVAIVSPPGYN